jgi:signal transduction histidine kinase/ABC-type uncharacterized transport system substrate-binding protein
VRFLWRMVVLMIATLSPLISATAEPLPRSVLILDQSNSAAPFPAALIAAFRSTLNPDARDPIAAYTEYLDFTRFAGPEYERLLHTYILEKYHGRPIGVIVVTGAAAFEFALRLRRDLGADIPLVFAMVDNGAASLVDLPPDVTGTTVQFSFCDAVIAARLLVPNIKRIALVGDPLASQSYYGHFKAEIPSCSGELELVDLTGLPMTELKKRAAMLPEDAAIVYTTIYAAAAGAGFLASDALAMIAEVANRPIVISQENFLGHGGAGGFVVSAQPIGQEAARLALRIIHGESASSIPVTRGVSKPVFDWRELQRWGISKAKLPPGSEVRFRPHSLWNQYRWQFIAVIVVLLTQATLISGLLLERLARRRAQGEIERALGFEKLLADISASLLGTLHRDINGAIPTALRTIAEFLGAERAVLWKLGSGRVQFEPTHMWIANGTVAPPTLVTGERHPWILARAKQGDIVNLANVDEMPPGSVSDRSSLRQVGIRSLLMVPLGLDGAIIGAISLATIKTVRVWPETLVPRLRLIGEVFASLLARQRAAEQVGEARLETGQFRENLAHLVRVRTAGDMSVAIAHEINQPLVAIKNYALAARRRLPAAGNALETAKVEELMDKIGTQASRAGKVINSLRAMVKMHPSETTMIDVGQLVADTLRLVQMENRIMDIQLDVAIAPDLMPVLGDAIQIQQVVLNLAHNGIEAMEGAGVAGGVLKVGVMRPAENEVLVSVADCGPGIAPDELEHVFDSFYSTKTLGLGIGLSISRSIVEAHGGRLSVASNTDEGSVFQFTLPVAREGD